LLHESAPEGLLGMQLIVRAAQQANLVCGGQPTSCKRVYVVKLQHAGCLATMSVGAHERAAFLVTLDNLPPNLVWNVSAVGVRRAA
jgi:hypothetical protein